MAIQRPQTKAGLDRQRLVDWYRKNRRRTRRIFDSLAPEAYRATPIPLRHPLVFYEGHLPAFRVNTLLKKGLGQPPIDAALERLFARGIDPADEAAARAAGRDAWPDRSAILAYAEEADRRILRALETEELDRPGTPSLVRGEAVFTILEHEALHHETLFYLLHRLAHDQKRDPAPRDPILGGDPPAPATARIPAGRATLGAEREDQPFGWDNEFPSRVEVVPEFEIDVHDVPNRAYLEFVEAGGYEREELWTPLGWQWRAEHGVRHPLFWEPEGRGWRWRGLYRAVPLPGSWPVFVSHAEATAYARWKGARLPTEAEFHRAAYGTPDGHERSHPWGEQEPDPTRGNFDFEHADPVPVGSYTAGRSAWGVHDLVGNGWEWTSTVFEGFPGFRPMASYPEYSADFFDGQHYVMKGASPATARELVRRSFRNWFRPNYPYVYASFRLVRS